ncbi:MAG: diaminopimelate epimerase [Clostridia bacterium]
MKLSFTKMHAAGNDYIYVDGVERRLPEVDWPTVSRELSRRHHSVGSDGLILILPSREADFAMRIFNADGSEGDMCGNGVRCAASYIWENGFIGVDTFKIETRNGPVEVTVVPRNGGLWVSAKLRPPQFRLEDIPMLGDPTGGTGSDEGFDSHLEVLERQLPVDGVRVGNPNCVIFVRDAARVDLEQLGPLLETHERFPEGTNVEFVQVIDDNTLRVRVWERGSGVTMACGTGAAAAVVCASRRNRCASPTKVQMPGGTLQVSWNGREDLILCGPVERVYRGSIELDERSFAPAGEGSEEAGP